MGGVRQMVKSEKTENDWRLVKFILSTATSVPRSSGTLSECGSLSLLRVEEINVIAGKKKPEPRKK